MAKQQARAGDATGRKHDELVAQLTEEQRLRAQELAMVTAEEAERQRDEIIDMTGTPTAPPDDDPVVVVEPTDGRRAPTAITSQAYDATADADDEQLLQLLLEGKADESITQKIAARFRKHRRDAERDVIYSGVTVVDKDTAVIRVNDKVENMTFGAGRLWNFEPGPRYKVPLDVAQHLEEKGLVYH